MFRYVVSAGVDNYPNVNKLNGCLNDARNNSAAFRAQQGLAFGKVTTHTLLDAQATAGNIAHKFQEISRQARAGDFVVLFLSGHGERTNNNQSWRFLPYDFNRQNEARTTLTDRFLLETSDVLVRQGKKVVIIVDACFAGQLRITAQAQLGRYRNPQGGGLILMLSSSANQTSAALGQYSAFAKALADSINGGGDLNRDGKVTLAEIRKHTYDHTYQLLRQSDKQGRQDSEVAWSPSISPQLTLASQQRFAGGRPTSPQPTKQRQTVPTLATKPPVPVGTLVDAGGGQAMRWVGSEDLQGYGSLSFEMHAGGRAVMFDVKGTMEGTWHKAGQATTLRFDDGRVTYSGAVRSSTLSGTASNGRTTWSFNVDAQAAFRGMTEPIR